MRINAYITAHEPLSRVHSLRKLISAYLKFHADVRVYITINNEAEKDIDELKFSLSDLNLHCTFLCAIQPDLGFALPWANGPIFKQHVENNDADYYIYQEDDILITWDNFKYFVDWKPILQPLNLEPGFIRYELFEDQFIPFDNHHQWSFTKPTPDALITGAYQTKCVLLNTPEAHCVAQLGNPYYGASILTQADAVTYVNSNSFDVDKSYLKSGFRDWPIADRRSMGLCFENLNKLQDHRRCIPVVKNDKYYVPLKQSLVLHNDLKYSRQLKSEGHKLINIETFLTA
jgi:hypothetical protein